MPDLKREVMARLPVENRSKNWNEVNLGLSEEQAIQAAKRCLYCGLYCMSADYQVKTEEFLKKVA